MNKELIEQLAKKAGFNFDKYGLAHGNDRSEGVDAEAFAELIVKECLQQVQKNFAGSVHTNASIYNKAVKKCKDDIINHFGVK